MRRVKTNGEHNKKGSPEVNGVTSSTRSMIWGLGMLLELQEVLELTWCYNRNSERVSTSLGDDGKRTKELLWKFFRGPSGTNVIWLDEYLISNSEFRCWNLLTISWSWVSGLGCGNGLSELSMEFSQGLWRSVWLWMRLSLGQGVWRC